MPFTMGPNNYGKSGIRLVRVGRDTPRHVLRDLTVHTALSGDLDATHYTGDNTGVLPTDTQKNTVYAFARDGIGPVEAFAERLARHFVDATPAITGARVQIEEHAWTRIGDHSFTRGEGGELRTTEVAYDGTAVRTASGVRDLLLLNTTDSEFNGFLADEYTTLPETDDRILATAVTATWAYATAPDYDLAFSAARGALLAAFADTYSLSLQQTLHAVGERILKAVPEVAEVRLTMPNRHHYLFDLGRFGLDNPGTVFQAGDLPYGLIEGTVRREEA
ncbi:factor-independent urate hydroxylase [Glycomyces algeriensis]|uniref:Uricase n=1 Tax=Glycomyces algeriensis TaxID=256037 RepID=A0A9W6LGA6_9ACTN|nr:urate oxidase [Glycomyces algeriensis]MDA1365933.1 urate oxidase [Glycomyces algeriensis]MDR7349300.1 urate oxidase [Glycomyces algeriensis]GLI42000.1 uricase [Glycomyces algeriensis]